jgi:hypothetical protein
MSKSAATRRTILTFEPLEGRALLSASASHIAPRHVVAHMAHFQPLETTDNMAVLAAIQNAIRGGVGSEWVKLIRSQVHNPLTVIRIFSGSQPAQYEIRGMIAKTPNWQSAFQGVPQDPLALTLAGALFLKKQKIELGAIVRGPFTTYPGTTLIIFAINRGAGQSLGSYFASRPGITPDVLVSVTVGPFGQNPSATITDLTTHTTQSLASPVISVRGPTLRILLNSSQLPSPTGWPVKNYTFASWTELEANAPINDVGSFIPENSMVSIGVETTISPTL